MGIFSKQSTPNAPAMNEYEGEINQNVSHFMQTWMPVQSFFTQENQENKPAMQDLGEGEAGSAAELTTSQVSQGLLAKDEARGAAPGSGAYTMDLSATSDAGAAQKGFGLTDADAETKRMYLEGVQKAMGAFQADKTMSLQGLQTAADIEQQEAQLGTDINNSRLQTVGNISSALGGMAIQKEMGGSGGMMGGG